jgi:prepilin-type N-terminal cleavage/methylation domain-containing protein
MRSTVRICPFSFFLFPCAGFTLIEVLVAIALFVTISIGIVHLFAIAASATRAAREQTSTVILAAAKMEQLRSLAWGYEPSEPGVLPALRSDRTTNLSSEAFTDDGPGLRPSPSGTLATDVAGYVDYLDEDGRWAGTASSPDPTAVFVRRWAVEPLPADPDRTLILQVLVTTVRQDRARPPGSWLSRTGSESHLVSVLTRKGR